MNFDESVAILSTPWQIMSGTENRCQCSDIKKYRWTTSDATGMDLSSRLCSRQQMPAARQVSPEGCAVECLETQ